MHNMRLRKSFWQPGVQKSGETTGNSLHTPPVRPSIGREANSTSPLFVHLAALPPSCPNSVFASQLERARAVAHRGRENKKEKNKKKGGLLLTEGAGRSAEEGPGVESGAEPREATWL